MPSRFLQDLIHRFKRKTKKCRPPSSLLFEPVTLTALAKKVKEQEAPFSPSDVPKYIRLEQVQWEESMPSRRFTIVHHGGTRCLKLYQIDDFWFEINQFIV